MKLLDLYVAKHVLGGFFVVLLVIVGLDMIFALIEEWFPEHTSILRPPAEPEQLDFMTLLEGQQAA